MEIMDHSIVIPSYCHICHSQTFLENSGLIDACGLGRRVIYGAVA
jgi:hypothetical protein